MNWMIHSNHRWFSRVRVGRQLSWVRLASLLLFTGLTIGVVLSSRSASAVDPPGPGPEPGSEPNVPPAIVSFTATEGILEWTFEGRVADENPMGMRVTFGGLLAGEYTSVSSPDGYFYFMHEMTRSGQVTAQTVDDAGQSSNTATAQVRITSY